MPLQGEYEPSTSSWSRKQADLYEATNGEQGADLQGRPVILLTSVGARTGKVRKTPLMRVERDGIYAVVASLGGAPKNPVWYYNLKKNPHVELQDRGTKRDYLAREVTGHHANIGVRGADDHVRHLIGEEITDGERHRASPGVERFEQAEGARPDAVALLRPEQHRDLANALVVGEQVRHAIGIDVRHGHIGRPAAGGECRGCGE